MHNELRRCETAHYGDEREPAARQWLPTCEETEATRAQANEQAVERREPASRACDARAGWTGRRFSEECCRTIDKDPGAIRRSDRRQSRAFERGLLVIREVLLAPPSIYIYMYVCVPRRLPSGWSMGATALSGARRDRQRPRAGWRYRRKDVRAGATEYGARSGPTWCPRRSFLHAVKE